MTAKTVSPLATRPRAAPPRVRGYRFAGVHAGLKKNQGLDAALIVSDSPAGIAGVFTTSNFVAAPVQVSKERLKKAHRSRSLKPRAILVNSQNANCATGKDGHAAALSTTHAVAQALELDTNDVFVASTGVIGEPFPGEKIVKTVPKLIGELDALNAGRAAEAIMTTDTVPKWASTQAAVGNRKYTVGGIAKGVGMVSPHMATVLGFLFTDAAVKSKDLQGVLSDAVTESFNAITVDGDTSTNDTVLFMANGAARTPELAPGKRGWKGFEEAVLETCVDLASLLIRDAEGASHVVTVFVSGAKSQADADCVARTIAHSPLVKTAIAGSDPNWGRVIMAIGRSGAAFKENALAVSFDDVPVVAKGVRAPRYSEAKAAAVCRKPMYTMRVNLGMGKADAAVTTTDLTLGYVRINADYRS